VIAAAEAATGTGAAATEECDSPALAFEVRLFSQDPNTLAMPINAMIACL
jgi:hypothetical protein